MRNNHHNPNKVPPFKPAPEHFGFVMVFNIEGNSL